MFDVAAANPSVTAAMAVRLRELHEEWPATIPFTCGVSDDEEEDGEQRREFRGAAS